MNKWYLASAYGEGVYNSCNYNETDCATDPGQPGGGDGGTVQPTPTPNPGSQLTNTGIVLIVVVTLACVISLVAILVRAGRRRKSSKPESSVK